MVQTKCLPITTMIHHNLGIYVRAHRIPTASCVPLPSPSTLVLHHVSLFQNGRATAFCDEHWGTIKAGLNAGGKRSDIEIAECVTLLSETISSMVQKTAAKQPAKEKKLILTIPVLVDEKNIVMKVSLPPWSCYARMHIHAVHSVCSDPIDTLPYLNFH
jgi:hypothetical protein